jgi:signal transduction histidine kinase
MKAPGKSKAAVVMGFEESYRAALAAHLQEPSEITLGRAYELGREAVREGKTLLDTLAVHHRVFGDLLDAPDSRLTQHGRLSAAADFLNETLSTFEMTHRGFQEAVQALRHMNETLEEQIKRLAYSVHDEAGQLLVVVHLELAEIAKDIPGPYQEKLARVNHVLRQIEDQLRRFSHELRPTVLDDLGWLPAIEELAAHISTRSNLCIKIDATTKERFPTLQETVLYRVVQESLTNTVKHAQAAQVRISVRRRRNIIHCCVEDDGVGCDLQALKSARKGAGLGLTAMRERLQTIGGTLRIDSAPGKGTTVLAEFPMEVTHERADRSG